MILTDILQYIPFTHLTREQVAELTNRSKSAIDNYSNRGKKLSQGHTVYLKKMPNGNFKTKDVIEFLKYLK